MGGCGGGGCVLTVFREGGGIAYQFLGTLCKTRVIWETEKIERGRP